MFPKSFGPTAYAVCFWKALTLLCVGGIDYTSCTVDIVWTFLEEKTNITKIDLVTEAQKQPKSTFCKEQH